MIRLLEELTMNAFPAKEVMLDDGWIIRQTKGNKSKRINSVLPIYPSTEPVHQKIKNVEQFFFSKESDAVFKVTSAALPAGLDEVLETLNYKCEAPTWVMTKALLPIEVTEELVVYEGFHLNWLKAFCQMANRGSVHDQTLKTALQSIGLPYVCVLLKKQGRFLGCGMGVLEKGYIGIYNILVDKDCRRQGIGKLITSSLLDEGIKRGCHSAYLQVVESNAPAVKLYETLGFSYQYTYWYRIKKKTEL